VLGVGQGAQPRGVPVWPQHVDALTAAHPVPAADHMGQVDRMAGQGGEFGAQPVAFRGVRGIVVHRLVDRRGHLGEPSNRVHACQDPRRHRPKGWQIGQRFASQLVRSDNMGSAGVGLGQLLLALDATLVSLIEAPRGLDLAVASAALLDSDDVRLGLAAGAGSADLFFLLGVRDDEALRWLDRQVRRAPVAILVKEPSDALVARAVAAGSAVVAVDPRARWERLYRLVNHVLEHHGDAENDSGTDLFGLAQSLADRIHGMVSIEDEQSHVLAYSASNDEADDLRRLSILGRAGPPEHLRWIGQWGIFDALRAGG